MTIKIFDVYKQKIDNFIQTNYKALIYLFGFIVIAFWTLYRFFIKLSTFDLVGQQLLTRQWLDGFHSNALIGTTNYILKMIFIYAPFNYLPGSPLLKIELMTLIINIATFVISIYFIKKIYVLFFGEFRKSSYLSILYFAGLAGSMYWIEFANSRNLEFAFGLGLIYLILSSVEYFSYKKLVSFLILSTLLFFSDPLQIYMSMVPSLSLIHI